MSQSDAIHWLEGLQVSDANDAAPLRINFQPFLFRTRLVARPNAFGQKRLATIYHVHGRC